MFRIIFASVVAICAAFACLSAGPAAGQPPATPSFDCSKATVRVEAAICHDAGLAAADALMARLFAAVQVSAFGKGPSNELQVQRKWLGQRATACVGLPAGEQTGCLLDFLNARNEDLAVAALFERPELALDALHRLDPKGAPLIEAIYLYASQPPNANWASAALASKRQRLLALLQPYADRFATEDDLSYGRDILKEDGIVGAGDAIRNAKSFASFATVASAYLSGNPVPRSFPCAALVRRPELLDMEGPVFGSTLDNFIASSDCEDTLPPAPQLMQLVKQIDDSWPKCEGTIRFSAYRAFVKSVDAALLATDADFSPRHRKAMPKRRGVSPQRVRAAIQELTAYYRTYGRASEAKAPAIAAAMVGAIMDDGHQCGE